MTSIRKAWVPGAFAVAAVLVGLPAARAQPGKKAVAQPVPAAPAPIVTLLTLGRAPLGATATPTVTTTSAPAGRPPISQPIPGTPIYN